MMKDFPYSEFLETPAWVVLEKAIQDLVDNQDLEEMTNRKLIVGYILSKLNEKNLLNQNS